MGWLKVFFFVILKIWKKILYCMWGVNLKLYKWMLNILSVELYVGRILILFFVVNFINKNWLGSKVGIKFLLSCIGYWIIEILIYLINF